MAHSTRLYTRGWLLPRQCVSCEDESPTCNCAADENCVLTSRTCSQCPTIQCNKKPSNNGGGVNPGVIAGPVVAILIIASLVLFWYLRRKKRRDLARLEELAARARKAEIAGFHLSQPGSPSPGSARSLTSARSGNSRHSARRSQRSPLPPTTGVAEQYDNEGKEAGARDPFSDGGSFNSRGTGTTTGGASGNVIPIQYIPPSGSDDSLSGDGNGRPKSQAARTLNEARENLWRVGAPQRPARAPGLDLRLNNGKNSHEVDDSIRSPIESTGKIRDSYLSGTSGAPSFSSGYTTDLHTDAPKIFTSKHVQLGRFQQAEVVQFGQQQQSHPPPPLSHGQISNMDVLSQNSKLSPAMIASASSGYGPNYETPTPISPSLSAVRSPYSSPSSGTHNQRTLTPQGNQRRYDDTEAEEMPSPDPNHHPTQNTSPTDLRFSMGSLAYRDSVSSMGTDRFLARPESHGSAFGPPRQPWTTTSSTRGERESMMSGRSDSDSVLGGYPMIPPNSDRQLGTGNGIPQSTSVATLDSHTIIPRHPQPPPPPPPTYRSPKSPIKPRPQTATSIADSLLGSFPFVPPNNDDLADLPSAQIPETAAVPTGTGTGTARNKGTMIGTGQTRTARNTAMSGVSEGLGGFEFRFEDGDEVPPVPTQGGRER